jgi:hypothetical protein
MRPVIHLRGYAGDSAHRRLTRCEWPAYIESFHLIPCQELVLFLQAGWLASLVCHLVTRSEQEAALPLQGLALSFGVLSVVFFAKAHLTHEYFVKRASHQLRRHLVVVVGLCAACLGLTGTFLLLVDPREHFPTRIHGSSSSKVDAIQARADDCQQHISGGTFVNSSICPPFLSGPWRASILHYAVALSFILAAGMSAHGVSGYILHGARRSSLGGWAFFQPFRVCINVLQCASMCHIL